MDVVLGARGNRRDWEGHVAGPDSAWACSGRSLVKFLIINLCTKEVALEFKLCNLDWVSCNPRDVEDAVSIELRRVRNTFGLIHKDLEVLHSSCLDERERSGHAGERSSTNTCWLVEHLLSGSDCDKSGLCKLHLF